MLYSLPLDPNNFSGGLVYSHDLQTCDWPRNVACKNSNDKQIPATSNSNNDINTDNIQPDNLLLDSKKVIELSKYFDDKMTGRRM